MFSEKKKAAQPEFWIAADQVVISAQSGFYGKLEETLESFGFAAKVRALCKPVYDQSGVGRPGIDPVVYLKMIMVGFFEDLPSERAIAARCADSMSIRTFLKYELHEKTPEHSSFTVIRQRLGLDVYQQIFTLPLQALREHGLLRGKNLGIESSVIEANASLRALVHRTTPRSSTGITSNAWLLSRGLILKTRWRCGDLTGIVQAKGVIKSGRIRTIRMPKSGEPRTALPT